MISDWESGISGITTDNGSNILAAMDLLQWPHVVPCFSHTLQLGIEKAMKLPLVAKASQDVDAWLGISTTPLNKVLAKKEAR